MQGLCGNKKCDAGEESTCPRDCCGDGKCSEPLEKYFCTADCVSTCGNNLCEPTDLVLCPAECGL
jgi:hypothetical protein